MRQRFTQGRYRVINDFGGRATRTGGYAQLRWTAGPLTLVPGARADRWSLTGETTTSPWLQARLEAHVRRCRFAAARACIGSSRTSTRSSARSGSADARAQRATQFDLGFEQRVGPVDAMAGHALRPRGAADSSAVRAPRRGWFSAASCAARRRRRFNRASTATPAASSCWCSARAPTRRLRMVLVFVRPQPLQRPADPRDLLGRSRPAPHAEPLRVLPDLGPHQRQREAARRQQRAGSRLLRPAGERLLRLRRRGTRCACRYYSRVDLRVNRTFNWSRKRLTLFGEIINVLNRDNVRFNPPGVSTATGRVSRLFESMIPIVPSVGILIEF